MTDRQNDRAYLVKCIIEQVAILRCIVESLRGFHFFAILPIWDQCLGWSYVHYVGCAKSEFAFSFFHPADPRGITCQCQ